MIPYYEKDSGIKTHTEGNIYVVLDKNIADAMHPDLSDTLNFVKQSVEAETGMSLDFGECFHTLSPDFDETYIINFVQLPEGGLLQ